jgi:phospholipid/cholesterol/gamma-HCH transport system substrate-binding protein
MNQIFQKEKVSRLIRNVEDLSFQTKEVLIENRKSLNSTISALNAIATKFQTDSTLENINTTLHSLNHTVVLMDTTISLLNPVIERLQNKESTFGQLVSDKKLYQQLVITTSSLDSLIRDMKRNPKKYIHFSLF